MNLTVVESPRTTAMTTLSRLKARLGLTNTTTAQDEDLQRMIDEATSAIEGYCGRTFARAQVRERLDSSGINRLRLFLTPVVQLTSVDFQGTTVTQTHSISDPDAGFIQKDDPKWLNTMPVFQGITVHEDPQPGLQDYTVDYVGGYLMPGDNILASGTLSALASDGSFNDSLADLPILVSGEYIRVAGFATSGNNGKFKVLSRTTAKIVVDRVLTDETPSGITTITCLSNTMPAALEGYCIAVVKQARYDAQRDGTLTAEKIGDWSGTYADRFDSQQEDSYGGLPPDVAQGLTAAGFARIY